MTGTEQIDSQESCHSQNQCHGDVARDVRTARKEGDQPHEVVYEDEEEDRQQVRCETTVIGAYARGNDVIDKRLDERFEESDESARCRRVGLAAAVAPGHPEDNEAQRSGC